MKMLNVLIKSLICIYKEDPLITTNGIFFSFLGLHLRHMEVPRLGVELELQLPAYAKATAMQDPSRICNLHYSSRQHQSLNPQSKGRDRTHNLMVIGQIRFCCTTTGTPGILEMKIHRDYSGFTGI